MCEVHRGLISPWIRCAKVVLRLPRRINAVRYPGKVERAILFRIEAWDVNCPQHIHKRFSQAQVAPVIEQLQARIADLEAQLAQAYDKARSTN